MSVVRFSSSSSSNSQVRVFSKGRLFLRRTGPFALFLGGTLFGLLLAQTSSVVFATSVDKTYEKLRIFSQVLAYVQSNYVDEISETELIYDSVNGMLQDLDPHSTFMRPSEYSKLKEDTSGEFGGLGIVISEHEKGILVDEVNVDGPADRAGLLANDVILAIDGRSLRGGIFSDGVQSLRGLAGTKVVLRIERSTWKKPKEIPLIRRNVRVVSVEGEMLTPTIGYALIHSFQERTDHDLALLLKELHVKAGKKGLQGLVLDLRDNPGGLLDEGVKVADRFLKKGMIVTTEGRNPRHREKEAAHPRSTEPDYPMVVLVNEGSASASEIVAGALQDQKRAVLVGQQSYGKGSVQVLFGLDDGAGLKLTVARYFTPSGRSIDKTGIEPDQIVRHEDLFPKRVLGAGVKAQKDLELAYGLRAISRFPADLGAALDRKVQKRKFKK